jgi:uncharacterized membrane protein YuzA (DUF378 family)
MSKLNWLDWVALVLVIIGGLNWGLVSINRGWDLVAAIFGGSWLATLVYALVGLSALYTIYILSRGNKSEVMQG